VTLDLPPGIELTLTNDGDHRVMRVKPNGKAKAKFKRLPQGPGTATATFGRGAADRRIYDCP